MDKGTVRHTTIVRDASSAGTLDACSDLAGARWTW
jgi:hypothetical protein